MHNILKWPTQNEYASVQELSTFTRCEKLKSFSAHANHHILNVISLYKESTRIVKANCTPTLEIVHGVVKENR